MSNKKKGGASHRKMADPLKRLYGELQICSTQAIFHQCKNSAFSRQFRIFSSQTIICFNIANNYSATFRCFPIFLFDDMVC